MDNQPNFPDHETPNPGYLLCCSGYQRLVLNVNQKEVIDPIYTAEEKNDIVSVDGFVHEPSEDVHVQSNNENLFKDKLGRTHYVRYMSGPTKLVLRAVKFFSSNAMHHANDMLPLLRSDFERGIGIAFLKIDNGGDWNLLNLINELYFCRLWKASKLDVLGIVSYAARYSAYNNIEHTWAPMSKKLTSVILPCILEGDECELHKQTISVSDISIKEAEVFDNAMRMIVDEYWKDATFNSYDVTSSMLPCLATPSPYDDYKEIHDIIMGPLRVLTHNTAVLKELRFLFNHLEKKSNEIIFRKCSRPACSHCVENPIIAVKAWEELERCDFKWPNPVSSDEFLGHFKTYREIMQDPSTFICADEGLPYSLKVGECPQCNFAFYSESEQTKHIKVIHAGDGSKRQRISVEHKCLFIIRENKHARRCSLIFSSMYELRQHKGVSGHIRKKKKDIIQEKIQKAQNQRSIMEFIKPTNVDGDADEAEAEEEDEDEGHPCLKDSGQDENTCNRCQGMYLPGSGDWLLCRLCTGWFHELCF